MTYREVGGSLVFQGTVSGTDQTPVTLHDPTHALRVWLENPTTPLIENNVTVFTGDGQMVINTTASGLVTITGAGSVEVFTDGNVITVSGGSGGSGPGVNILNQSFTDETFVNFVHNFNTINYLTTVLDVAGKVLESEITQNLNTVELSFNEAQSGTVIVIGSTGLIQTINFSNQTQVFLTHNLGTIHYLTTVLDSTGKVIGAEITQDLNDVEVNFNVPQSGVVIVIGLSV